MGDWEVITGAVALPYIAGQPDTPVAKVYFFSGDEYCRYDIASDAVDEGPLPLGHWPGLVSSAGAAVWPNADGSVDHFYTFDGTTYSKYNTETMQVWDDTYPRQVNSGWTGAAFDAVGNAAAFPSINLGYLYGTITPTTSPGGLALPENILQPFGIADHSATAAPENAGAIWGQVLAWPTSTSPAPWWPTNVAYCFSGDSYTKFDVTTMTPLSGYPKLIADGWHGLPMAPPVVVH